MAAPTLQAEGSIVANTTGDLTVSLPAHQADDILIVTHAFWAPVTSGNINVPGTPSGWTFLGEFGIGTFPNFDGRGVIYWKRATSGSETNPLFTRPSGMDTGNDTCWAGRAYVIRGCVTSGNPWDEFEGTLDGITSANGAFPAITVSGSERMVVQFCCITDNSSAGAAPTGWTAGTAVTTATGTDGGFQTFRKDNVSTSTSADTSNVAAPTQGGYGFFGVSFKPPTGLTLSLSDTITLSDSVAKGAVLGKGDTITLSDAISRVWTVSRSFGDTITLTDGIGKGFTHPVGDTITLSDSAIVTRGLNIALSDSITLSDSLLKGIGLGKADTIALSDGLGRAWSVSRSFADTVSMSDAFGKGVFIGFADTLTLSDAISKSAVMSKSDQITLTDSIAKSVFLPFSDAISLSDAIGKAVGKSPTDTITLTDAFEFFLGTSGTNYTLSLQDTITLTDALAKTFQLSTGDTIVLLDGRTLTLNGNNIEAATAKRHVVIAPVGMTVFARISR